MGIYKNIIKYCEANGISSWRFEAICGLPNGIVGKWRDGYCQPSLKSLYKIEKATGVPMSKWLEQVA